MYRVYIYRARVRLQSSSHAFAINYFRFVAKAHPDARFSPLLVGAGRAGNAGPPSQLQDSR